MKKPILVLILLITVCSLSACGRKKSEEKNSITIYSLNIDGGGFYERPYSFRSSEPESMISELLSELMQTKTGKYKAVFTQNDFEDGFIFQNNAVSLRLNPSVFKEAENVRMLRFAALVKSIFGIDSIHEVRLLIGEKDNATVLSYSRDSFFDTIEQSRVYQKTYLYFSDLNRSGLYEYEALLPMDTIDKYAYQIVETLIKGPEISGCMQTIPPRTEIRSVVIDRNVCYVDLSSEFFDYINEMPAYLTLYSVVNSLTRLAYIQEVVFLVNGNKDLMYRDLDLQTHFSFNRVIINGGED